MAIKGPLDVTQLDRQVYTVAEVCILLGLRKSSAYDLIAKGRLPAIKLGTQVRVPKLAIERLLSAAESDRLDRPGSRPVSCRWTRPIVQPSSSAGVALPNPAPGSTPRTRRSRPDDHRQLSLDLDQVEKGLRMVVEAKDALGENAARSMWRALGLPQIRNSTSPAIRDETSREAIKERFRSFLEAHVKLRPNSEVRAKDLYERYESWVSDGHGPPLSRSHFGKLMRECNVLCRKSGSTVYVGLALIDREGP